VAPELFKKTGYSYKADVFSMGSVFFNLLSGRYLFSANDPQTLLIKNIKCQVSHIKKYLMGNTSMCRDLLFKMIEADPEKRPTAKQALMHEWFKCDKGILIRLLEDNYNLCQNKGKFVPPTPQSMTRNFP
jgi:serine/threonine protein kinase